MNEPHTPDVSPEAAKTIGDESGHGTPKAAENVTLEAASAATAALDLGRDGKSSEAQVATNGGASHPEIFVRLDMPLRIAIPIEVRVPSARTQTDTNAELVVDQRGLFQEYLESSKTTRRIVNWCFGVATLIVATLVVLLVFLPKQTIDRLAASGPLLNTLVIILGILTLLFGLWLTWHNVENKAVTKAAFGVTTGIPVRLTLETIAPGLVFALFGTILILGGLYRDYYYSETGFGSQALGPERSSETGPKPGASVSQEAKK